MRARPTAETLVPKGRQRRPGQRRLRKLRPGASTDLVGLGLLAGAAGLLFIAVSDIGSALADFSAGAEPIAVSSHAPAALPAAVGLGAFAALLLRRRGTPRGDTQLMAAALLCVPLMLLLPVPYLLAWRRVLTEHGYVHCETGVAGRRALYRWSHRTSASLCL